MSQITLARTKPSGSVVESFDTDDRVDCTSPDGTEESYEIDQSSLSDVAETQSYMAAGILEAAKPLPLKFRRTPSLNVFAGSIVRNNCCVPFDTNN